jgi:hypothetical protein
MVKTELGLESFSSAHGQQQAHFKKATATFFRAGTAQLQSAGPGPYSMSSLNLERKLDCSMRADFIVKLVSSIKYRCDFK